MAWTAETRAALGSLAGAAVWAAHFTVVYAWTAFACARGGLVSERAVAVGIVAATVVALVAGAVILVRAVPRRASGDDDTGAFLGSLGAWIAALGLVGVLWTATPVVFVGPCSAAAGP